ncbi:pre-rRNA 2'-O-ribose RNA methyltransferase FTSJ3-like [Paramacrobiotus metropolitanus]|uniref:pre-rRNA 2'-O-ribose RNA methyltransferase FTSJ3-like n=1 Tax=Paramacrobiotus metropolitanus TaxID=2943436 RepID=UPI002445B1D3|nr:pre-rRNA 2'-O-ribose RNA methyltransferase FTSJ3-like [Paramacrobiotus metropolitanus]
MGKKTKVGKARKDKFYHLAKETGYRSRAAFKLIQLNRSYEFLQKSRVLIDLCAAPGGWLQVARQFMPVSSIIVGVDLVPIKPLPNVITFTDDITTEHCKQKIRHELKTWKADVVLHDGAPNVGKNWLHDAFAQARLTLSAFKLASDCLAKGGWFITKVFRSKDYHALLWVFKQFFRKVVATKPPASRNESAEIFVVCSGYLAPDKIDPRLLDPKSVFQDVDGQLEEGEVDPVSGKRMTGAAKLSLLMHPERKKKSAEGYGDGKMLLLERLRAQDYIDADDDRSKELLSACHEIVIDDELKKNPATTEEVILGCQDIKVLGRRELKIIMAWRNKLRRQKEKAAKEAAAKSAPAETAAITIQPPEDDEETAIQKQIDALAEEERLEARRKRKKINKLRRQLQERMNLKMVIPGDSLLPEDGTEQSLFALDTIHSKKGLEKVVPEAEELADDVSDDNSDGEENPLLVERETRASRKERMMEEWFDKEIFRGVDWEGRTASKEEKAERMEEESDSEEEMEFEVIQEKDEEVEEKPVVKLDPEGFALAEELIKSRKRKREIIEAGFHREAFNEPDSALPSWFVDDEKKHCRKSAVDHGLITKEQVATYKDQLKAIDARPIKKIAEAQARKKRRAVKRLEKARKKAGKVLSEEGQSSQEKIQQLKSIYKKAAGKVKRKAPTLVVSKKGGGASRPEKREKGSRIKVVDRRMKKDIRGMKRAEKAKKKVGAKGRGRK